MVSVLLLGTTVESRTVGYYIRYFSYKKQDQLVSGSSVFYRYGCINAEKVAL